MKDYSEKWKSSKKPAKQRKYRFNAPNHIRTKFMGALLDKPLKEKYGKKTLAVRTGDKVKILRGQFKGKEGKIDSVNVKRTKVYIEKIEVDKKDGTKAFYPINPSNVMIIELKEDKRRIKGAK